jgi:mono/diheme cytochrome c family protein
MKLIAAITTTIGICMLAVFLNTVSAAGTHTHTHDDAHKERSGANNDQHGDMAHHRHDSWAPPPKEFASLKFEDWGDTAAARRGSQIYQQQCVACHGADGKGTGPAAAGLEHPPADLTNHFHSAPGNGDGYLFWRVSEGGVVEPFRSQKSAMPPFKGVLSESERWGVLTYIHQKFHGGFSQDSSKDNAPDSGEAAAHEHKPGHSH